MNDTLFRKSSMDRLKSPEQLNDYIRVANPGVWLVLGAIILLLVGIVIWGVFGTVESTVDTGVLVENGTITCYVGEADAARLSSGMEITIGETTGLVKTISTQPVQVEDSYLLHLSNLSEGDFCFAVIIEASGLADGTYAGEIVVERISPISFVVR